MRLVALKSFPAGPSNIDLIDYSDCPIDDRYITTLPHCVASCYYSPPPMCISCTQPPFN